ncbi:MAG TPA: SBBP repeat-containing protein, partial [Bryobacteraceae bacterium]
MSARTAISIALLVLARHANAQTAPGGGVLSQFTVNSFSGTGTTTIQAMTTDAAGNVYIAGTTSAPDMVLVNAAQPQFGDATILRSLDRGLTWQKLSSTNVPLPISITPHPTDPQTLYVAAQSGIYKTSDGAQTWRQTLALSAAPPTQLSIAV